MLALLFSLAGLAGLVIPGLPGALMLFAGLFAAAWAEDFLFVGWWMLTVLGSMALLTYLLEFAATALGAGRFGASKRAIIGAVIGELTAWRSLRAAGRAGLGGTLGVAIGAAAKLAVVVSMIGLFVLARLWSVV